MTPEAINTMFPGTKVQLCIVHMVRNFLKFVSCKDRKAVTADLKKICLSVSDALAQVALEKFSSIWDFRYHLRCFSSPMVSRSWKYRWNEVIPFLKFLPDTRKAVYTTNAIESVNYTIRKIIKNRQSFPTDEAAMKLIFMAVQMMDNARTKLERGIEPVRAHLWGQTYSVNFTVYTEFIIGSNYIMSKNETNPQPGQPLKLN